MVSIYTENINNRIEELKSRPKNQDMNIVIMCAEDYLQSDFYDAENFNNFFEGCFNELNNLIGGEDVKRAYECVELYVEHFGATHKNHRLIYPDMIECILTMVLDYN